MNACCSGCSAPSRASPSTVVTLGAILHDCQRQAGIDAAVIDQHRAGAALPVIAALLGAGEIEMVAQRVQQRYPRRQRSRRSTPLTLSVSSIFFGNGIGPAFRCAAPSCAIEISAGRRHPLHCRRTKALMNSSNSRQGLPQPRATISHVIPRSAKRRRMIELRGVSKDAPGEIMTSRIRKRRC